MSDYKVIAPLVVARNTAGVDTYTYQGGILPEDLTEETIDGLLDIGLIEATPTAGKSAHKSDKSEGGPAQVKLP
jgi:hypothetical protein